jgi:hypothetical protein
LIENDEYFCKYNYSDELKASEFLHEEINSIRKEFIGTVNMKSEQDMEIKDLMMKKNYIKNRIGKKLNNNKYIITEDIINEESKEYTSNCTKTKNNSNITINMKINNNNNNLKLISNDALDKNLYMINQEKFIRKKLIFSKTVSPKLISNIYQMKNNLSNALNNNSYIDKSDDEIGNENEPTLKSFNSSLDVTSSYHKSNYEQPNEVNLNLNENKLLKTNMMGLNENDNIATDNNSASKSNKNNNQYSFVFNINEKQNDEADFIFTMSQKE